jgi:hypothetical protein
MSACSSASEPSDEQETWDKPSTSTTAPTSTPECPEKPMESNERALSGTYFNSQNN